MSIVCFCMFHQNSFCDVPTASLVNLPLQAMATDPTMFRKSDITILRVTAKRSRLVIDGEMGYDGVKVPFSYRTSLGVKGKVRSSRCDLLFTCFVSNAFSCAILGELCIRCASQRVDYARRAVSFLSFVTMPIFVRPTVRPSPTGQSLFFFCFVQEKIIIPSART